MISDAALICIAGPTASGKSALALRLAQRLGGEIISADSMQLYRGLEIGTAQPTAADRSLIPHHLFGCLDLSERVDVTLFVRLADEAVAGVFGRGRVPIVVGGTGLYLKALLHGLDDLPADPRLRADLDRAYDRDDRFDALRERMRELDPASESRWHNCRRKLIRALEVRLLSGRSLTELQTGARPPRYRAFTRILQWSPDDLRRRIAERARFMLQNGWIREAADALAAGLMNTPTARQALGYGIIGEYLAGNLSMEEAAVRIINQTCQLARRQRTWFRHQHPEAVTVPLPGDPVPELLREWRVFVRSNRRIPPDVPLEH